MSDNWVVQNLQNALSTWNEKLAEIWTLLTEDPEHFKGGVIWRVIVDIHGALQAIGVALPVLFSVSKSTVKHHVTSTYRKLGVASKMEMINIVRGRME